jgi:hypothetical protein
VITINNARRCGTLRQAESEENEKHDLYFRTCVNNKNEAPWSHVACIMGVLLEVANQ